MATGTLVRPLNTRFERQWNEAEAIRSIFYEEFEETKFPWKSDHLPQFTLHLKEQDIEGGQIHLDLEIIMIEGYPDRLAPELKLVKRRGLTSGQVQSLMEKLEKKASELIGSEMVFDIVEEAKTLLSMVAKKKVSFHDEMVNRRAVDEQQTRVAQRERQAKVNEAEMEKRRVEAADIDSKIRADLQAKEKLLQEAAAQEDLFLLQPEQLSSKTQILFVPELSFPVNGIMTTISSISMKASQQPISWIFGEICSVTSESGLEFSLLLVTFTTAFYASTQGKRKLEALVRTVREMATGLPSHPNVIRVLGAQLEFNGAHPVLQILVEPVRGTRLDLVLKQAGSLGLIKAISYLKNVLTALGHLHLNGVVHRNVRLSSLFVSVDGSNIYLAFPHLARALLDLDQVHPVCGVSPVLGIDSSIRPPEALSKSNMSLGRKADIWQLGMLTMQMLLGHSCLDDFEDLSSAIEHFENFLPEEALAFIRKVCAEDPSKRPLVSELSQDTIFSLKGHRMPLQIPRQKPILPIEDFGAKRTSQKAESYSRYKSDFEEIQFLGKGAFGAVIKVRNRIDNRYYAVKRIKLDRRNPEENQKILREVTTLSRLHHDRIIRYYQAWIEGQSDSRPRTGSTESETGQFGTTDQFGTITSSEQFGTVTSDLAGISFRSDSDENGNGQSNWLDGSYQDERANDTVMSNSSLLNLAINHTGFSEAESTASEQRTSPISRETSFTDSEEEDDEFDETDETAFMKDDRGPYLYIQMEYCPNQTLRDFIDEGLLDMDEVWRLFRQLLEGLAYIHSQGMIHRDLKPSNIFLDSNGDIKIGDFGLAVDKPEEMTTAASASATAKMSKTGLSLTGAVGTPFYMSPEQARLVNARYTSKVDMYSAGIIFVELCCGHFATTMERIEMLRAVRTHSIQLPTTFTKPEMSRAKQVVLNLLDHDPKVRLSAADLLLRADLIPPKVEDEAVKEAIRSLTVPGNPHYSNLLGALFANPIESFKDFTFDLQSGSIQDPVLLNKMSRLRARLKELWTSHGAIELAVPLLVPVTSQFKQASALGDTRLLRGAVEDDLVTLTDPVTYLDASGTLVHLPSDLATPFARFAAHNRICELRRFSFDRVYRRNPAGGQPRQFIEGAFDVLHPLTSSSEVDEACLIKTAFDSVATGLSKNALGNITLFLSSIGLLETVASSCGIEAGQRPAFYELLARTYGLGWLKRRNAMSTLLGLSPNVLDSLARFQRPFTLDKLTFQLRHEGTSGAVASLKTIIDHLAVFGLDPNRILIDPLFCLAPEKYSGIMFAISLQTDRRVAHLLAFGGRYDRLLAQYAYPRMSQTGALGFQLSLTRLSLASDTLTDLSLLDVLVFSSGSDLMLQEKMLVAADLWSASIKTDFLHAPNPSPEILVKACKRLGVRWLVILREHASKGPYGTVKVRDVERKQEIEIARSELVETIQRMIGEKEAAEHHGHHHHSHSHGHAPEHFAAPQPAHQSGLIRVHIFAPFAKIKPVQRAQISERALKEFGPIFSTLSPSKPLEILAHEVSPKLVRCLVEVMGESEEVFRKAMEAFPGDRDVGTKFRAHLRSLKERGDAVVPLYHYRDNLIDIITL